MGPTASGARRGAGAAAEAIARALVDDFDWRTYEFASAPGAAHPRALRFLLAAGLRLGTPHAAKAAVLGLDALVNSEAYDSVDGGFFVACDGPGWKDPQTGKPLALNAELVVALSLAAVETGREGFARAARETVGWFDRALSRADDDLWAPGLAADPEYYALLAHGRARRGAPAAVEGMESRASALAVSALAAAGAAGEDRALAARGRLALQSLLDQACGPRGEVSAGVEAGQWAGGESRPARVALVAAGLDTWCVTGDRTLPPRLESLAAPLAGRAGQEAPAEAGAAGEEAAVLLRCALLLADLGLEAAAAARADPLVAPAAPPSAGSPAAMPPSAAGALGLAQLALARGVIAVEGVAGSALAAAAYMRCAPFGATVVLDTARADRDENVVVVTAGDEPPRSARRRAELGGLVAAWRAAAPAGAAGGRAR